MNPRNAEISNEYYSMASKLINIRWIRIGSQPYQKPCIASNYTQFSTNIKIKIKRIKPVSLYRIWRTSFKAINIALFYSFKSNQVINEFDSFEMRSILLFSVVSFMRRVGNG